MPTVIVWSLECISISDIYVSSFVLVVDTFRALIITLVEITEIRYLTSWKITPQMNACMTKLFCCHGNKSINDVAFH